jgi:hypothetical protein
MLHPNAAIATTTLTLLQFLTHDHAADATQKIAQRTTAKFKRRRARLHQSINPRSPTILSRFSHDAISGNSPKQFGNMSALSAFVWPNQSSGWLHVDLHCMHMKTSLPTKKKRDTSGSSGA